MSANLDEPKLRVWGRTNSVNVQKVLWCLAEIGVVFERMDAGQQFGQNQEPWFLEMNPNGKIPLLVHGDFSLWESNTIVRFLCSEFDSGGLYALAARERANAERWMDWELSTLARPHSIAFWNLVRTPPAKRDMEAVERAVAQTNAALDLLDAHLAKQEFVAGSRLSMGDIPVGAVVHRWLALEGIERPEWPSIGRWFASLAARPAYRANVMLPLS